MQITLDEANHVLRYRPNLLVVEQRLGMVMANAGIDQSNIDGAGEQVLLLPEDPDRSAEALAGALERLTGVRPAILITDSVGRAWRIGTCGIAIGAAGIRCELRRRRILARASERSSADNGGVIRRW